MTYDPNAHPINQPRRQDRTVTDDGWIEDFLLHVPSGVIATEAGGQPFANTNLFAYQPADRAIYFHTNREGRLRFNISANPRVCFTAHRMGRLLPADSSLEFSLEYASVVVFGRVTVLEDPQEAEAGLRLLLEKYFPMQRYGRDYRPVRPEDLARTAVYRLKIESWSAKRKSAAEDFPGAFWYPG